MSRTETLNKALAELQASSGDVEACAVISEDGLIIASLLPQGTEDSQLAAMSVAMLSMATRAIGELKRGHLEQIFVKSSAGYLVIQSAGAHAVLLALTRKEAKLGLIFFDLGRAASRVAAVFA